MKRRIVTTYSGFLEFRQELLQTEMFETAHGMYLRLKGTPYEIYPGGSLFGPTSLWRIQGPDFVEGISFEEVLDHVEPEIQTKLLFHLDLMCD